MLPTVLVDTKWWDLYGADVVSEAEAATALLGLIPTAATIPEEMAKDEAHWILLASLAPPQLVAPLHTLSFLSQAAAWVLVKTRATSLHLTEAVQPLLACMMIGIKEAAPCLDNLRALDLEDQVTGILNV